MPNSSPCFPNSRPAQTPSIQAAVEGQLDTSVARRLIAAAGGHLGRVYGGEGKDALIQKLDGCNRAAGHGRRWLVLVDLNAGATCAPALRARLLPDPAPGMCLRIVVPEIEAWLMADAQTLARCLRVRPSLISRHPERLDSPKDRMVDLARGSRRRQIREDMVPGRRSGRRIGRAYTARLIEYVRTAWRPRHAACHAVDLQCAIRCLERLVGQG